MLFQELQEPSDTRIFTLARALEEGYNIDLLYTLTKIDKWFLVKLQNIIQFALMLESKYAAVSDLVNEDSNLKYKVHGV